LVFACAAGASCGPSSPSAPSFFIGAPTITYTGNVVDSAHGDGIAAMMLATVQGVTSGTVDEAFNAAAEPRRVITGSVTGGVYSAQFSECPQADGSSFNCSGPCTFSFVGSLSSTAVSGNYTAIVTKTCSERTGTMTLATR
jgi:hypothetical protein